MVISQGDVCWAECLRPQARAPGFGVRSSSSRAKLLNRSRVATVVCVPLTSNLRWADAPGDVLLTARMTGLPRDSVANVSQVVALDRTLLEERVSRLSRAKIDLLLAGLDVVLGR